MKPKQARTLTQAERTAVAEYAINNPEESDRNVAVHFGCTAAQVRYAVEQAEAGRLKVRRDRLTDEERLNVAMIEQTATEIFAEQLHLALVQVADDKQMSPVTRVSLLAQLARMKRTLQETAIEAHIKSGDAEFLARLVRRFQPTATDDEVILILNEEFAAWKHSASQN
jgi:hypothetical protein